MTTLCNRYYSWFVTDVTFLSVSKKVSKLLERNKKLAFITVISIFYTPAVHSLEGLFEVLLDQRWFCQMFSEGSFMLQQNIR